MYKVTFAASIHEIDAAQWNNVVNTEYPFIQYGFLSALETSGATTRKTGWQPQHLIVTRDDVLVALLPLYEKYHSYGEYVFDWAWAEAYERNGVEYYPKLLSCIPYTPATGPRLCIKPGEDDKLLRTLVLDNLFMQAKKNQVSSIHLLFPDGALSQQFKAVDLKGRIGAQFHWFNQNYQNFDGFLASFSSRKRKNVRKERKKISEYNLTLRVHSGSDISQQLWERFYQFYQRTYLKRSGHGGYLNQAFFLALAEVMPEQLVMVVAYENDLPIAAALNFVGGDTLYGRYWGCEKEYEFLHFETCYYQGIDYCIQHGLAKFDPGAQGEHKISRGFTPIETYSNHWIAHPGFSDAIDSFLVQEQEGIKEYIQQCNELLPFRREVEPNDGNK